MIKPPKCDGGNSTSRIQTMWIAIFAILITIIASTFAYQRGFSIGRDTHLTNKGEINPIIDGEILYEEWNTANLYMYPQWIRFDNTSLASNEWNFLSVGDNDYSLFISIDMVSITSTLPSETLEIHLLLNGDYFTEYSQYMILQDWGVEAMVYDFENNEVKIGDTENTLDDPSIEITYGSSLNSNTTHRKIEIGLLKEDMRYYTDNGELGILIIGHYDGGSYYFAASSPNKNITYYNSANYIGIDMGNTEEIYI